MASAAAWSFLILSATSLSIASVETVMVALNNENQASDRREPHKQAEKHSKVSKSKNYTENAIKTGGARVPESERKILRSRPHAIHSGLLGSGWSRSAQTPREAESAPMPHDSCVEWNQDSKAFWGLLFLLFFQKLNWVYSRCPVSSFHSILRHFRI